MKLNNTSEYLGGELELFQYASNWKKYFSKQISPHIKGDVIEVGAGIGANTEFLFNSKISSWTCLEPDSKLASEIPSKASNIISKINIVIGTIESIENAKFDTIIYIDVLEHIKDSRLEIQRAKQRLKINGKLIILVPAYNFLFNEFDKQVGHYRRYNKHLLLSEVNSTLKCKRLFYLDSFGFFASVANKYFLKKTLPSSSNINFWDKILIRISKPMDFITFKSFGKSLIGIFEFD